MVTYGAKRAQWQHFKRLAKTDLLPVVSNPHAPISPYSKMKSKGKTPSVYNHKREVIGMTDWTEHETSVRNIEAWAEEPDFGICIQTRKIRGFDVDVPDRKLSDRIVDFWLAELDLDTMPTRFRKDSGKQLLAFKLDGEIGKRSFVVRELVDEETGKKKRWLVEFLANGQQFVAVGTHPDGEPYEWDGGLPDKFPTISVAEFERAWSALVEEFAIDGTDNRAERRDPTMLEDLDVDDPVAEHLIETWDTYGIHKGMLYLDCPWKENHSSDSGETETAWMLAGTGKYRKGHFACRHAGCAEHTDADFMKAVGFKAAKAEEFEDLSADDPVVEAYTRLAPSASPKSKELKAEQRAAALALPLPGFNRDAQGRIEVSLENVTRALRAPQAAECWIAYDTFRGELMLAEQPGEWRSMTDADSVRLRITLAALGFKNEIGKELMRDALELVGSENQLDSAREWLLNVVPAWDGVSRIHRFWPDYMRTKDTRYTEALGNYSWTAQAARILDPGCKVDMVPVLVGPEGLRKSSAIAMIAPAEDFFAEFSLDAKDEELARKMRGCLVGELAELRGISARDGEAILAWITRRTEKWTPKFKEFATTLPRRLVFYGTTNEPEFMQPHMGQRRWLPITILETILTDLIERDRLQLWAEARDVYMLEGILYEEVEQLAKVERAAFKHIDPWHDQVAKWLDEAIGEDDEGNDITPRNSGALRAELVLTECLNLDAGRIKRADQQRIGEVLKALDMVRVQGWIGGRNTKVWKDTRGGK